MTFSSRVTMATASSQRVATVPFQGLPRLGRKEGTQRGWGQWARALGWASQAWMLPPGAA